jgi:hypothetical protein
MFAPERGRRLTSGAGQFRSSENTNPAKMSAGLISLHAKIRPWA